MPHKKHRTPDSLYMHLADLLRVLAVIPMSIFSLPTQSLTCLTLSPCFSHLPEDFYSLWTYTQTRSHLFKFFLFFFIWCCTLNIYFTLSFSFIRALPHLGWLDTFSCSRIIESWMPFSSPEEKAQASLLKQELNIHFFHLVAKSFHIHFMWLPCAIKKMKNLTIWLLKMDLREIML